MKLLFIFLCILSLSACTTPRTILRNPKTGQVAICGGSATGSMLGGAIGYNIQKNNDAKCADEYMKRGFDRDQ